MNNTTTSSTETFESMMMNASQQPLLTNEQEMELVKRIQNGDSDAQQQLCSCNQRFVLAVARRFQNQGLTLSELISAGNQGLTQAAEKYNGHYKFIPYAVWWIRQSIIQTLGTPEDSSTISKPCDENVEHLIDTLPQREAKILRLFLGIGCAEKTVEEIGKELELTPERVRQIKEQAIRRIKSNL